MVFVLDRHQKPLMPCTEKRARLLLDRHRAVVHKMFPFTIRLKDREQASSTLQPVREKLDPGSHTTGLALIVEGAKGPHARYFGEIVHKITIKEDLASRKHVRQNRRSRHTRYRIARYDNRCRIKGWLPPSLAARVDQTLHVTAKLRKLVLITDVSVEHVAFDTQKMQDPEISGVEYQQGTLLGYEVREYLLLKWEHTCAYCGEKNVPLEVEHIVPQHPKHGIPGSSRLSNLTMACNPCNTTKDNWQPEEWLAQLQTSKKAIDAIRAKNVPKVLQKKSQPLHDAAYMNATRWRLYTELKALGLPLEGGSGGRTKKQRIAHDLPKEHYFDALCIGKSTPKTFVSLDPYVQIWTAKGRGTRQMCHTNQYGFPVAHRSRHKVHHGFQTGDLIQAIVPKGKYTGTWIGRMLARATGRFDINVQGHLLAKGISYKYCRVLQRTDGWQYNQKRTTL